MLDTYRYRGRHRAPASRSSVAARVAVAAAVITAPPVLAAPAHAGPPGGWDAIIACESGGDPRAQNPRSSASGLFQFIDSTWRSVGGTGSAKDASVAEQYRRAELLYDRAGTRPWNASRSCWAGKTDAPRPERAAQPAPAPRRSAVVDQRAANGTGRYTCTPAKLYFEACDPHNLGAVVSYPPYQTSPDRGAPARPAAGGTHTVVRGDTLVRIAAAHGTTWRALHAANPHIADPALIFPGQRLTLP